MLCFHLVQGSGFRVQGRGGGFAAFFYWGNARKWHLSHQSLLRYEGRNRLTCMVADPSAQSLPVLAGAFPHIERFRPLRMTIREERMDSYLGDMLRVLELAVLYYDTSSPLEKGRAKGAGWIHATV